MSEICIQKCGYVWLIDLAFVADHRAKHYAANDPDTTYQDEYDFVMGDDYEGIDWYQNNMNWSDIPDDKKRLTQSPHISSPDDLEEYDGMDFDISIVERE